MSTCSFPTPFLSLLPITLAIYPYTHLSLSLLLLHFLAYPSSPPFPPTHPQKSEPESHIQQFLDRHTYAIINIPRLLSSSFPSQASLTPNSLFCSPLSTLIYYPLTFACTASPRHYYVVIYNTIIYYSFPFPLSSSFSLPLPPCRRKTLRYYEANE